MSDKITTDSTAKTVHIPEMYLGGSEVHKIHSIAHDLNRVLGMIADDIPFKIELQYRVLTTIHSDHFVIATDGKIPVFDNLIASYPNVDAILISFKTWLKINKPIIKYLVDHAFGSKINDLRGNFTYRYFDKEVQKDKTLKILMEGSFEDELMYAVTWKTGKEAK